MRRRALLLFVPATLAAQTERRQSAPIYRCGTTLSDRPCSGNAASSPVGFDQPSDADARAARQRAREDAREARRLERERERQARRPAPAPQGLSAPAPQASSPKTEATSRTAGRTKRPKSKQPKSKQSAD